GPAPGRARDDRRLSEHRLLPHRRRGALGSRTERCHRGRPGQGGHKDPVALRTSLTRLGAATAGGPLAIPVEVRPKMLFNPDLKSANFIIPGLIGIIMQNITILLTAFAIVRERERGTLEQLMV